MTKVVLLNGPPRSGKDTVAQMMTEYWLRSSDSFRLRKYKFAGLLHDFWQKIFYAFADDYEQYQSYVDGSDKSNVLASVGIAYRTGMISLSEDFVKPMLGKDFFGLYTAKQIAKDAEEENVPFVAIISDSGFAEEAVALIEEFGAENILLVHLFRDGSNFSGDSRSYINLDTFGVTTIELDNISIEQLERDSITILTTFMAD